MSALEVDDRGVLVTCPTCGQRNRLAFDRLGEAVRCGKCKTALSAPGLPLEIASSQDFDRLVAHASLPIVVDFWAPWCGPCRMVAPELVKVAGRAAGQWLVIKVNTDVLGDLGERFGIRSIPTMAVFAHGREVARTAGARPAADIEAFVRQALSQSVHA
jgi:thioredoxin 2